MAWVEFDLNPDRTVDEVACDVDRYRQASQDFDRLSRERDDLLEVIQTSQRKLKQVQLEMDEAQDELLSYRDTLMDLVLEHLSTLIVKGG